ncbi:DUF6191 domain-containing protein [Kitasatospora griseola]|uniref:DUF6191 domain-containing protein n=1 Tax=Kitasatospora griseola TaxID=2064 RepID=UPI0036586DC9
MVLAFSLTLPGLALALVMFLVASRAVRRLAGSGLVPARYRRRPGRFVGLSSTSTVALDVFTGSVNTGKAAELEERSGEAMRRDEEGDAAPPRSIVDLGSGRAVIVLPKPAPGADRGTAERSSGADRRTADRS